MTNEQEPCDRGQTCGAWRLHAAASNALPVGGAYRFPASELPAMNPLTGEPGIERFRSNLLGMAWGAFTVTLRAADFTVDVRRQEPGTERVWTEWDRRQAGEKGGGHGG